MNAIELCSRRGLRNRSRSCGRRRTAIVSGQTRRFLSRQFLVLIDAAVQAVCERQFSIHGEIGPQVVQVNRVEFTAGAVNAAARDHLAQDGDCYLRVVYS